MNAQEADQQRIRLKKFDQLSDRRSQLNATMDSLTKAEEDAPNGQTPFTGNYREARFVRRVEILFSPTNGGAPAVRLEVSGLNISAAQVGDFLIAEVRAEIDKINKAIAEL